MGPWPLVTRGSFEHAVRPDVRAANAAHALRHPMRQLRNPRSGPPWCWECPGLRASLRVDRSRGSNATGHGQLVSFNAVVIEGEETPNG